MLYVWPSEENSLKLGNWNNMIHSATLHACARVCVLNDNREQSPQKSSFRLPATLVITASDPKADLKCMCVSVFMHVYT